PGMPDDAIALTIACASVAIVPSETVAPPTVTVDAVGVLLAVPIETPAWLKPAYWPSELVRALAIDEIAIVWPAFAPTWNCCAAKVPSSRFRPLNWVWVARGRLWLRGWGIPAGTGGGSVGWLVDWA